MHVFTHIGLHHVPLTAIIHHSAVSHSPLIPEIADAVTVLVRKTWSVPAIRFPALTV